MERPRLAGSRAAGGCPGGCYNRCVVERYKSTFDGEIVRWPCKGKSKTGKQPRQIMSLGAVQRFITGQTISPSGGSFVGAM